MEQEGVIKFSLQHSQCSLVVDDISLLAAWRQILIRLMLVGRDPQRYGGLGFGNVSMRTSRGFLISGSQTGHLVDLGLEHYAEVINWSLAENRIVSEGLIEPSSESLTHAAVYQLSPKIRFVFHAHSPDIWQWIHKHDRGITHSRHQPGLAGRKSVDVPETAVPETAAGRKSVDVPETAVDVVYGTPAMAREVARVCAGRAIPNAFVMGGHEDGVVAYGSTALQAGSVLINLLADSLRNC